MIAKIIQAIKLNKSFQGKTNNRNHAVLSTLKNLGFPLSNIRKALIVLNNIKYSEIAGNETSIASVSNTVNGNREAKKAKLLISQKLDLTPEELFHQGG
jgi:hypothetical protein